MELDDKLYKQVTQLCEKGDSLMEKNSFGEAEKLYSQALHLLPPPKSSWEAATWIYTALGDSYFFSSDYAKSAENYFNALNCPDGISNPYIQLKLGQSLLEQKRPDQAKEHLLRAYMLAGEEIFTDEDTKYFELIKSFINSPNESPPGRINQNTEDNKKIVKLDMATQRQINELMDKSNEEFDRTDYPMSIQYLEDAWALLPEPKGIYDDSFHIVRYLSETYLMVNNLIEAEKWARRLYQCGTSRMDVGERDFLLGKVLFEADKRDEAKELFALADKKSEGRCFEDEDKKYFNLLFNQG